MRQYMMLITSIVALSGCNSGLKEFPTAKVSGKVLCEGEAVSDVRVYFRSRGSKGNMESGKVGAGSAKADGTFAVSTYGIDDGAVVGTNDVIVDSPHPEDFPNFNCNCETHSNRVVQQVEVAASGENSFTINLPKKTKKSKPNINPKDLEDIKASNQADVGTKSVRN